MFEGRVDTESGPSLDSPDYDFDVEALLARDPSARRYFEDDPAGQAPHPVWRAELDAMPPEMAVRIWLEADRPLRERDPQTFTDAEAITRLVEVEAGIARSHALRAELVALVAETRPAADDRPRAGRVRPAGRTGSPARPHPSIPVLPVMPMLAGMRGRPVSTPMWCPRSLACRSGCRTSCRWPTPTHGPRPASWSKPHWS